MSLKMAGKFSKSQHKMNKSKRVAELNIQTFVYVNFVLLLLLILPIQMHLISAESVTRKLLRRHKCEILEGKHFQMDN
jgi:hypothetical protein